MTFEDIKAEIKADLESRLYESKALRNYEVHINDQTESEYVDFKIIPKEYEDRNFINYGVMRRLNFIENKNSCHITGVSYNDDTKRVYAHGFYYWRQEQICECEGMKI